MIGKRVDGSGIILLNEKTGETKKVKFFHSNNHRSNSTFGWHKVNYKNIENDLFDLFVFSVYWQQKVYSFILSFSEINNLVSNKKQNDQGYYHFYFEMIGSKFYETKDSIKEEIGTDVTMYLDKWKKF